MKKKKLLFFIPTLGHGGAEKVLVNLVNNLDKEKYDVTVQTIFSDGVNNEFLDADITYKSSFKKTFRGFSHVFKLFSAQVLHRFFIKETYDIEIAFLEGVCTRIISGCQDKDTALISWVHCTMHDERELAIGFRSIQEVKSAYEKFHGIVCVSQGVQKAFNLCTGMNDKTRVVFNVNESTYIRRCAQEQAADVLYQSNEFNICSVGKVIDVKGYDRLACVQKRLRDNHYPTHVYILGVGEKQDEIEAYIKREGLEKTWTFLGYNKNPYVWVANSDLFVCSSRSEGLSTAVTEALLVGTPIVTTDVSGMNELLDFGKYGVIVDNNEDALYAGIRDMIDNTQMRDRYRELSKKRGEDFTKEKIISQVELVLDQFGGVNEVF